MRDATIAKFSPAGCRARAVGKIQPGLTRGEARCIAQARYGLSVKSFYYDARTGFVCFIKRGKG